MNPQSMRNASSTLRRYRRSPPLIFRRLATLSRAIDHGRVADGLSSKFSSLGAWKSVDLEKRRAKLFPSSMLHQSSFSSGFTSVHGGRPSTEYAKLRKESLESEFGHALGAYSSKSVSVIFLFGPFLALYRATIVSYHVLKLTIWRLFVQDIKKRSIKFRETLIHLGPFYVKLGQALSTRPDILPTVYCQELSKLQDQIPPFSTHVAIKSIESQLGAPISQIFADISSKPIAAASLGQVYKALQLTCILGSW